MGRKQKLREEKRKIKNNPRPLSVAAATATTTKIVAPAPAVIIVPPDKIKNNPPLLSVTAAITATATKTVAPASAAIIVPPDKIKNNPPLSVAATATVSKIEAAAAIIVPPFDPFSDCNAFPKSHFHKVGAGLLEVKRFDLALDAFKRGAAETGCVPCMSEYVMVHIHIHKQGSKILRLPWLLEGAIRGHTTCMFMLFYDFYCEGSILAFALRDYWERIYISVPQDNLSYATKEMRKNRKKEIGTSCFICSKIDTNTLTLQQCIGCSFYCYCSEICQTTHWDEMNHRGECRQLNILNDYHKPYAKIIRKAIIRGDDPKRIPELQTLRTKLGLNRPEEDYRELVELLSTDDNDDNDIGTSCFICSKIDTNTLPLKQCIGCSFYCYCSEDCQSKHWDEMNHRGECQQLNILNDYHKPYAKIIRKAIIRGDDPKHIPELKTLRTKLDLNRPKEDYKELVDLLNTDNDDDDDDDNDDDLWNHRIADKLMGRPNPYRYVTTEKGTVHIGSTPELI